MSVYSSLINSLLKRKFQQILGQIIKPFKVINGNPVLINSFPKSGTHLLYQLFENLPNLKKYNTFVASMPSVTQIQKSEIKTVNLINSIVRGELVRSHLFYKPVYDKILNEKQIVHFFIYRDPRDVVISEANYLYDMNKWHRLHKYYKKYPNLDDRIMFSIKGNAFHKTPITYPNVVKRFEKYKGWLSSPHAYPVRYEDLAGKNRYEVIKIMMSHYLKISNEDLDVNTLVEKAISNINPRKSHTFREGGIQKWKKYFNEEHKEVFKNISGELLIELGYEEDLNW